jgi:hypothetical protein
VTGPDCVAELEVVVVVEEPEAELHAAAANAKPKRAVTAIVRGEGNPFQGCSDMVLLVFGRIVGTL